MVQEENQFDGLEKYCLKVLKAEHKKGRNGKLPRGSKLQVRPLIHQDSKRNLRGDPAKR
jgi:hypothetical protein